MFNGDIPVKFDFRFKFDERKFKQDSMSFTVDGNIISFGGDRSSLVLFDAVLQALFGGARNYIPDGFKESYLSMSECGRKKFSISHNSSGVINWGGSLAFDDILMYYVTDRSVVESRYLPDKKVRGGAYKSIYELFDSYSLDALRERFKIFIGAFNPVLKGMGYKFVFDKSGLRLLELSGNTTIAIDDLSYEMYAIIQIAIGVLMKKSGFYAVLFDSSFPSSTEVGMLLRALSKVLNNKGCIFLFSNLSTGIKSIEVPSLK